MAALSSKRLRLTLVLSALALLNLTFCTKVDPFNPNDENLPTSDESHSASSSRLSERPTEYQERNYTPDELSEETIANELEILNAKKKCVICLKMIAKEESKTTNCKHTFHESCIQTWMDEGGKNSKLCPICRSNLVGGLQLAPLRIAMERVIDEVVRTRDLQFFSEQQAFDQRPQNIEQTNPGNQMREGTYLSQGSLGSSSSAFEHGESSIQHANTESSIQADDRELPPEIAFYAQDERVSPLTLDEELARWESQIATRTSEDSLTSGFDNPSGSGGGGGRQRNDSPET